MKTKLETVTTFDKLTLGQTIRRVRKLTDDGNEKLYVRGTVENVRDAKTGNRILLLNLGEGVDGKNVYRSFIEGNVKLELEIF